MENPPYPEWLAETGEAARQAPPPDSPAEQEALQRFRSFFENMTPDTVRQQIASVYAPEARLYDTLAAHRGLKDIQAYFEKTAQRAAAVRVHITDVLRKDHDFFIRWTMDITWSAFKKGKTTRSYGMSHLRMDKDGRILLHYDFWDSSQGFFQHLPVLGFLIRKVKQKATA